MSHSCPNPEFDSDLVMSGADMEKKQLSLQPYDTPPIKHWKYEDRVKSDWWYIVCHDGYDDTDWFQRIYYCPFCGAKL